jgi:hypothetical protein
MKNNDVILSYPFSGSIYAFLSDQLGAYHTQSDSNYYRTLFGKNYSMMTDMALTLAILYDNIVMPSVDIPLPEYQKYTDDDIYFHKDLGIKCYQRGAINQFPDFWETERIIDSDIEDNEIQTLLGKIPKSSRNQILREAHEEIRLAVICRCRVLCSTGRGLLIKRLLELDYRDTSIAVGDKITIDAVRAYKDITGLTFNPSTLDDFHSIKSDGVIRNYAREFTNTIHEFKPGENPQEQLFDAMATAMNTSRTAEKISGVFSYSSSVLGVAGLIPLVGTVTGAIGIGTDALTRGAEFVKERNEWYQLAPKIVQKQTEKQIQDFIKNRRSEKRT